MMMAQSILAETHPLDYLIATHGHPSTWGVNVGKVVTASVNEGAVHVVCDVSRLVDRTKDVVMEFVDSSGKVFWEALLPAGGKKRRIRLCIKEK